MQVSEENLVVDEPYVSNLMDIVKKDSLVGFSSEHDQNGLRSSSEHPSGSGSGKSGALKEDLTISGHREYRNTSTSLSDSTKVNS